MLGVPAVGEYAGTRTRGCGGQRGGVAVWRREPCSRTGFEEPVGAGFLYPRFLDHARRSGSGDDSLG